MLGIIVDSIDILMRMLVVNWEKGYMHEGKNRDSKEYKVLLVHNQIMESLKLKV